MAVSAGRRVFSPDMNTTEKREFEGFRGKEMKIIMEKVGRLEETMSGFQKCGKKMKNQEKKLRS